MRIFIIYLCTAIFVFSTAGLASALPVSITDLYGDMDGFGMGVLPNESFNIWDSSLNSPGDNDPADMGNITDRRLWGDQTYSHTYDISYWDSINSASLEIMTGGQGLGFRQTKLFIDGEFVASLTDGQVWFDSIARLDIFDLTPYMNLLDGANAIRIDTNWCIDAWVLDYSKLTITGQTSSPVPEPATLLLLGSGLIGMFGLKKRRK